MPSSYWQSVTYGNGKFVAVVSNSNTAAYSTDGITWTETTMPSSANWYSVTYGDGKFVAVASNSSTAAYSTDGITWTETTMPSSANWYSVTYGDGKFVAVANNSSTAAYKIDGKQLFLGDDVQELEAVLTEANETISQLTTDLAAANASWAGTLTFSGSYANSTYYTQAGCSLGVDKTLGYAYVTIQGGTSTSYENVYFTAASLPSGVSLLAYQQYSGASGTTKTYYTCVLTGITGKINVSVNLNSTNSSYDYVQAALTVTYIGDFTFVINNTSYYADNGMTWSEWCQSRYNAAGCHVNDVNNIYNSTETNVVTDSDGALVTSTDVIINGESYLYTSAAGGVVG